MKASFPFFLARRYLFSKKSHNAINIISAISATGVAVATMALVVTLSVFNGFHDLVASLFTSFDAELRVVPRAGGTLRADDPALLAVRRRADVRTATSVMEDYALVVQNGQQYMVTIKGVDDTWAQEVDLQRLMYPAPDDGLTLHADVLEYGVLGIQLASKLGLQAFFPDPITVYAPRRGERVNIANPMASFNHEELNSPGMVFQVRQSKYDASYIVTSLGLAQRLFDRQGRVTALELQLKDGADVRQAKREIEAGGRLRALDRYEQQSDTFNIMSIEKFIAYLFLTFILLVACFNIIGSLSMLMIEKRTDVGTLRSLGATEAQVRRVFLFEGALISTLGAAIGIAVGVALCWVQEQYGLVPMGSQEGSFIIESYPIAVHAADIALTFATVVVVSLLSTYFPVRYLSRNLI